MQLTRSAWRDRPRRPRDLPQSAPASATRGRGRASAQRVQRAQAGACARSPRRGGTRPLMSQRPTAFTLDRRRGAEQQGLPPLVDGPKAGAREPRRGSSHVPREGRSRNVEPRSGAATPTAVPSKRCTGLSRGRPLGCSSDRWALRERNTMNRAPTSLFGWPAGASRGKTTPARARVLASGAGSCPAGIVGKS